MRRFSEEAQQLIQFRHDPSVVACLDLFRANGTAYLVMEYVEGVSLAELLRRREAEGSPLTEGELRAFALPLLEGLSRVHAGGVLHRDIKPSNILVRRDDEQPVLIDFGAAKQNVALNTKSFAPLTDGYAAMEQVGDGKLGTWTDMYGVGAVLWQVVAGGNPPWRPPNPLKVESRLNALARGRRDPMPLALEIGDGRFSNTLLNTIDKCLVLRESDRVQSCDPLLKLLYTHRLEEQNKQENDPESNQLSTQDFSASSQIDIATSFPQYIGSTLKRIVQISPVVFAGFFLIFFLLYELLNSSPTHDFSNDLFDDRYFKWLGIYTGIGFFIVATLALASLSFGIPRSVTIISACTWISIGALTAIMWVMEGANDSEILLLSLLFLFFGICDSFLCISSKNA